MKLGLGFLGLSLMMGLSAELAHAQVTPASLSLSKVKEYLEPEVVGLAQDQAPITMYTPYLIESSFRLQRGKYSEAENGFADFLGTASLVFVIRPFHDPYRVNCRISAQTQNVPFAMQEVPVLEQEINAEQLVLKKHKIVCRLEK